MPIHPQHTDTAPDPQLAPLVGDRWTTEVVPGLPADLEAHARRLKAFQRKRGVACAADLLRALLAYVLCAPSFRRLGAWAVLLDLADLSDTAWRKRLATANLWLLWLLSEFVSAPPDPHCRPPQSRGRILLIDATILRQTCAIVAPALRAVELEMVGLRPQHCCRGAAQSPSVSRR